MSLEVAYGELHTCSSRDHEACETRPAYRPATRENILAAVRELGGKERNLCREHHARLDDGAPGCGVWMAVKQGGGQPTPCYVIPFLIIPLDTGDTE